MPRQYRLCSFPNILGQIFKMASILDKVPCAVVPIHSLILSPDSQLLLRRTVACRYRRRRSLLLPRRVYFFSVSGSSSRPLNLQFIPFSLPSLSVICEKILLSNISRPVWRSFCSFNLCVLKEIKKWLLGFLVRLHCTAVFETVTFF